LGSGTVTANARGDIYLEEVLSDMNVNSIVSTSGNVGLMANLSILNASGGIAAEVTGADISLDAINGNIGIAGNDLDIKATGTLTSSSYGNANIIQTDGDLSLNTVATVSGTAYISAPAGRILNGASSGYNIASGKTYLFAQNDIGTSANPITTQVGFLEGLSTLGAAYITNTGSMTIGGVTGSPTGFDTAGPLVISAMSPITIETSVSSGDDITITASDDDPGDVNSIVVEDGVTISSKKNVTLDAGDNITIMKGAEIDAGTTNAPGTIFMYAANHANLGSNYNYGAVVELYGTLTASSVDIFGGVYGN